MSRKRRPRDDLAEPFARDAARECCLVACVTEIREALGRCERCEMRRGRVDAECDCCSRALRKKFASTTDLGWPVDSSHYREGLSVNSSVFGQYVLVARIIVYGGSPTERADQTNN